MKANCGFKTPDFSSQCCPTPVNKEEKMVTVYPSITLRGKAAELFMSIEAGKSFDAGCRLRLVEKRHREGSRSPYQDDDCTVELEIESIEADAPPMAADAADESAGEAMNKYFTSK